MFTAFTLFRPLSGHFRNVSFDRKGVESRHLAIGLPVVQLIRVSLPSRGPPRA